MSERYDDISARHYAAYRPGLHSLILKRLIPDQRRFGVGLDVGCGTGYSSVALSEYCDQVVAIDSSESMLAGATRNPRIHYHLADAGTFSEIHPGKVDVVTFAGSLMYAKNENLKKQLLRVCQDVTPILIYDFQILLNPILATLGIEMPPECAGYDYEADLSGWSEFEMECKRRERVNFQVDADQLAHLWLSDSNRYDAISKQLGCETLFEVLKAKLEAHSPRTTLTSEIYYSRWHLAGLR